MPLPRHRVDLVIVPQPPGREVDPGYAWQVGVDRGLWTPQGGPGAVPAVDGGFGRARQEVEAGGRLVANRLGGFRVRCPVADAPIVRAFEAAVAAWRRGGARGLVDCPACGRAHALEELSYAPPVAFGRPVVTLVDVARGDLTAEARAMLEASLGALAVVAVRPS